VEIDERVYPTEQDIANSESYVNLGDYATSLMEVMWLRVRATSSFDSTIFPLTIIILLALAIFVILYVVRKHRKSKIDY
jgi:hypothetical protein